MIGWVKLTLAPYSESRQKVLQSAHVTFSGIVGNVVPVDVLQTVVSEKEKKRQKKNRRGNVKVISSDNKTVLAFYFLILEIFFLISGQLTFKGTLSRYDCK